MTTEQRLENIEKELARAKRLNRLLLAVVLLAVVAMSAGISRREDVVRAKGFIVVDENGKIRATLVMLREGPLLGLFDENGKVLWQAPP